MLEPGGIVGHDVGWSWDVEVQGAVTVLTLQGTGVVAEVGRGSVARHSSLVHARHCRGVVSAIGDGGIPKVKVGGHERSLAQDSRLLQVAVGDVAFQVVHGHESPLDVLREGEAPNIGLASGVIERTAHPYLGSFGGAQESRFLGHDFGQVCRS